MADEPEKDAPEGGAADEDTSGVKSSGGKSKSGESKELPSWSGKSRSKKRKAKEAKEKLEGDDAFQRGVKQASAAASNRLPAVIGGVALLVGGIAAGVWWWNSSVAAAAASTRVLADAVALESRGIVGDPKVLLGGIDMVPPDPIIPTQEELDTQVEAALAALDELGDADTEQLGQLVRGARLLREGKAADAQAAYEGFISAKGRAHSLSFLAYEGKAFSQESQGDLEGALATFEELAGKQGDFYRDMALYQQGRLLERLERKDEAIAVYRQYVDEYPPSEHSMAQEQIKARLEELDPSILEGLEDSKEEAFEIDAPPPPVP